MGFDRQDLLKQASVAEGDTLLVTSIGPSGTRVVSTSSSTYSPEFGSLNALLPTEADLPGVQLRIGLAVNLSPGSGEEVFARLREIASGNVVPGTEVSRTTTGNAWSDWNDFTLSSASEVSDYVIQVKTEPGTNTSQVRSPHFQLGLQL